MRIRDRRVVFFDTETTGNDTSIDQPIELAVVAWQHGCPDPQGPRSWFIKPDRPISPAASAVHHLVDDDVADAPSLAEVLREAEEYLAKDPHTCLSAHNANFDLAMLPSWRHYPCLDTLRLVRHLWSIGDLNAKGQPLNSHTMQELRYWLGLHVDTMGLAAHRAAADILVTGAVYEAAVTFFLDNQGEDDFDQFLAFIAAPVLTITMPFGDNKGTPLHQLSAQTIEDVLRWQRRLLQNGKGDAEFVDSLEYALRQKAVPAAYQATGR